MSLIKKVNASWQLVKELGPLGPIMIFAVVTPGLGALLLVYSAELWLPFLENLQKWAVPVYILLTMTLAGLSLIPTHASSLVGGMLFGVFNGPVYALLAVVAASYFAFGLVCLFIKESSYNALLKRPRAARIHQELLTKSPFKSVFFIALIRLSPVMPFAGTNVVLAASRVQTSHFLLGSFIGLAPRVILVAVAGAGLAELDFAKGSNVVMAVLGGVATLLLISYIGWAVKKVSRTFSL